MRTIIFIAIVFTALLAAGCSPTTYVSLTENNTDQIENKINEYGQNNNQGAEVTLSLQNGKVINGELLSIRESTVTICTEQSATEKELAGLKYPIKIVQNEEIQKITIEGGSYFWTGLGYGVLGGAAIGALSFFAIYEETSYITQGGVTLIGGILGALAGAIVGGIIGATSYDDIIIQEIPYGYDLSILKPLARYPNEEPEYLRAIK